MGRLEPSKGVFDLLVAFRGLCESSMPVRLVFPGDGRAAEEIRHRVRLYGRDGEVDLLGVVKNRDVPSLMRGADVLVAPSVATRLWAEQVGNVLLQAMACRLPGGINPVGVNPGVCGERFQRPAGGRAPTSRTDAGHSSHFDR